MRKVLKWYNLEQIIVFYYKHQNKINETNRTEPEMNKQKSAFGVYRVLQ